MLYLSLSSLRSWRNFVEREIKSRSSPYSSQRFKAAPLHSPRGFTSRILGSIAKTLSRQQRIPPATQANPLVNFHFVFALAPGAPSGFKGWIRKYSSGYVAADEKLYLFFRCGGASNLLTQLKRVRRKRSNNTPPPPPPRPCINDTMPADLELGNEEPESEEEQPENGDPTGALCE